MLSLPKLLFDSHIEKLLLFTIKPLGSITKMKAFLVISQCLPACRVLIIGFEGIVEGFLVVQMKHAAAAAVFFLRRLGQLHSEALKRQTF